MTRRTAAVAALVALALFVFPAGPALAGLAKPYHLQRG